MKTLLLAAILLLNLSTIVSANEKGNGGSGDEVETVVIQKNIEDIIFKINRFFENNSKVKEQFPVVNFAELSTLASAVKIEITTDELYDKEGVNRTCLNFRSSHTIQCNRKKIAELSENVPTLFVLVFHELLSLMNVEESSSEHLELIENYKISQKLRQYVSKFESYDLVVRRNGNTRFDLEVNNDVFETYSCQVLSLDLDRSDFTKFDNSIDLKKIYKSLRDKGYIFDSNYEQGANYLNSSLKNGLVILIGTYWLGPEHLEKAYYRTTRIGMVFQEDQSRNGYEIRIVSKTESRQSAEFNLEKAIEWGLKNVPKCKERK
jgi:hypothetical protein